MKAKIYTAESGESKILKKIASLEKIAAEIDQLSGGAILTKGVFDILHFGHLNLFAFLAGEKRRTGFALVVAVASDSAVQRKKGPDRPFQTETIRAYQIAAMPFVDWVTVYREDSMSKCISAIKPKIYVKGQDTSLPDGFAHHGVNCSTFELEESDGNPEIPELMRSNSQVIIFCDKGRISTTDLVAKIVKKDK